MLVDGLFGLTAMRQPAEVQPWKIGGVASQTRRQQLPDARPVVALRIARETAFTESGNCYDIPFQPLGAVHGQHLDPVGPDLDRGRFQAVFLVLGGLEIGQERTDQ